MDREFLKIGMSPRQYSAIQAAATRAGVTMAEWSRRTLAKAAHTEAAADGMGEIQAALRAELRPHVERLAALTYKVGLEAGRAAGFSAEMYARLAQLSSDDAEQTWREQTGAAHRRLSRRAADLEREEHGALRLDDEAEGVS